MSFIINERRPLTCTGCGERKSINVEIVYADTGQVSGEVHPQHDCGEASWIDLPEIEDLPVQERYRMMRPALLERGELVETPYGDMTREQFHEHARVLNNYYTRLGDEMRDFRE